MAVVIRVPAWGPVTLPNDLTWHGVPATPDGPPIPDGTPVWELGEATAAFKAWEAGQ